MFTLPSSTSEPQPVQLQLVPLLEFQDSAVPSAPAVQEPLFAAVKEDSPSPRNPGSRPSPRKGKSKYDVDAFVREYLAGSSTIQIAERHRCLSVNVVRGLRQRGVKLRPKGLTEGWAVLPDGSRQFVRFGKKRGQKPSPDRVLRKQLTCHHCGHQWQYDGDTQYTPCPVCGRRKFAKKLTNITTEKLNRFLVRMELRQRADPELRDRMAKATKRRRKMRTLAKIAGGRPVCVRCGCDDVRLLEINHKKGGGAREQVLRGPFDLGHAVLRGDRTTEDLEVLCKPCNALHYLELKFGSLPMYVMWKRPPRVRRQKPREGARVLPLFPQLMH